MKRFLSIRLLIVVLAAGIPVLAGCKKGEASAGGGGPGGPGAMGPPPEVGVVTVSAETVPITSELPGRISAVRIAEVRARVAGIVLERLFTEGSDVKAGDVLLRIDPALFEATLNSAKARLAKTEANVKQAQARADRYKELVQVQRGEQTGL